MGTLNPTIPYYTAAPTHEHPRLWWLDMYQIAIFKIRPEPDSTGYQTNYPAGTGYLDTCCIIGNCLFSALCAHTLLGLQLILCKTVGLHDSLVLWSLNALTLALAPGELSSTNCQKGYPVSGTVLVGTGFEKMPNIRPTGNGYPVHPYWWLAVLCWYNLQETWRKWC